MITHQPCYMQIHSFLFQFLHFCVEAALAKWYYRAKYNSGKLIRPVNLTTDGAREITRKRKDDNKSKHGEQKYRGRKQRA